MYVKSYDYKQNRKEESTADKERERWQTDVNTHSLAGEPLYPQHHRRWGLLGVSHLTSLINPQA